MANFGMFGGGLTLKALLENPDLQSPPVLNNSEKEKKENDAQFDVGSAFLGPNLWDKTYDNTDINLEYMDLDEFLSENGIPINLDPLSSPEIVNSQSPNHCQSPNHSQSGDSNQSTVSSVPRLPGPVVMGPPESRTPPLSPPLSPQQAMAPVSPKAVPKTSPSPGSAVSPRSPCEVDIKIDFNMSPTDMALVSIPVINTTGSSPPSSPYNNIDFSVSSEELALVNVSGEENFDPRKRTFSEEELKPQPMIKKSKKVFVCDDAKDDKYWQRRKKNNVAAKRSRDARRIKENQIAMRAAFLEKENSALKVELEKMKKDNIRLKTSLAKYEPSSSS